MVTRMYYSTKDVQTILAVSRTTANQIMHIFDKCGQLFRSGSIMRVKIRDFEEWVNEQTESRRK